MGSGFTCFRSMGFGEKVGSIKLLGADVPSTCFKRSAKPRLSEQ